jgi:hypothetical protein
LNQNAEQRKLTSRDESSNFNPNIRNTSCSRSTFSITQSGAIHPAVARYKEFQLNYDNSVLTQYTTGLDRAEHRAQAKEDQMREGQAEMLQTDSPAKRIQAEHQRCPSSSVQPRDQAEQMLQDASQSERVRAEHQRCPPDEMQPADQAEQERPASRCSSGSSSTETITQSGTIHPAVARYGDVPVLSGDNNILTSNQCPGTLQRDVKMDQEAEDATQPGGAIIGPRGAVGCKGEGVM